MSWLRRPDVRLTPRAARGRRAEALACGYLDAQGYDILARNVRFPIGEIDIVAREGQTLCFIEVRSASSVQWGGALASITDRKRQRVIRAAQWYLHTARLQLPETRFDVVAIEWRPAAPPALELVRGAFTADA